MLEYEGQNLYEILGVERGASADEISQAYRQLLFNTESSDEEGGIDSRSIHLIKSITLAYRTLSDEDSRKRYDAEVFGGVNTGHNEPTAIIEDLTLFMDSSPASAAHSLATVERRHGADRIRTSSNLVYDLAHAFSPENEQEIPEEWKRERAFFDEHFEEILKPGQKVNLTDVPSELIDDSITKSAISLWDDTQAAAVSSTRFGTMPGAGEVLSFDAFPAARRSVRQRSFGDPFSWLVYFGLPLMLALVAVELYLYSG